MALTKEQQRAVQEIAIPVDARGAPARAHVGVVTRSDPDTDRHEFRYRAFFAVAGGREREYVGPDFRYPRDAMAFAAELNARAGLDA
jgi:hypothetical protein